jgi:hypothetical protein
MPVNTGDFWALPGLPSKNAKHHPICREVQNTHRERNWNQKTKWQKNGNFRLGFGGTD